MQRTEISSKKGKKIPKKTIFWIFSVRHGVKQASKQGNKHKKTTRKLQEKILKKLNH